MRGSIIIVLFFCSGLGFGLSGFSFNRFSDTDPSVYALYLLMFLVGISAGADKKVWKITGRNNIKILIIPAFVITGTLSGCALCSLFLTEMSLADSLAVGSGFGYYSLSSIIISKFRNETLGVIALIANISREILTLLFTPLLVRFFGRFAPILSGGATSMDTTLPVIIKYSGKDCAIPAIFNGIILTLLVPFIIGVIYEIAEWF